MFLKASRQFAFLNTLKQQLKTIFFVVIISLILATDLSIAQWQSKNTDLKSLVADVNQPKKINAISDGKGGGFIVWEDDKIGTPKIFFLHFDENGNPTHRADGKNISQFGGVQSYPTIYLTKDNEALVCWFGIKSQNKNELFAQRVKVNGSLQWNDTGIQLKNSSQQILEYSVGFGDSDETNIVYLTKEVGLISSSTICVTKIKSSGKKDDISFKQIYQSNNSKKSLEILCNENLSFIFWVETINGKEVLRGYCFDENLTPAWGTDPLSFTNKGKNIQNYQVTFLNKEQLYITWQYQNELDKIYHQIIKSNGKNLFAKKTLLINNAERKITDYKISTYDGEIYVSWISGSDKKELSLRKISTSSNSEWSDNLLIAEGNTLDKIVNQFTDSKGNIFLSWAEANDDSISKNIIVQKISSTGNKIWQSSGMSLFSVSETSECYALSDAYGGVVFVFKSIIDNKSGIFGKRIYKNGSSCSTILSLNAEAKSNSVLLNWFSEEISDSSYFIIDRRSHENSADDDWIFVDSLKVTEMNTEPSFEYTDKPEMSGTIYYRVTLHSANSFENIYNIARVNFFKTSEKVIVAQNIPNPFRDSTNISFYLPKSSKVNLEFYNSRLEKVDEIKNEYTEGTHEITFNANGLSSGIYFYRFKTGEVTEVKKMVVVR